MSVAERMAPISASDGSLPAERICSMVTMGQAKHSRPSHSVDQAQISVSVVPRHHKNAAAAIETPAALCGDSPFQASHAPTATTRLPKAALRYRVQDGITIGCACGALLPGDLRLRAEPPCYTVRLTKNAAA